MTVALRPYQEAAVEDVRQHVAAGRRRVLLVAGTGSGKCCRPDTLVWSEGLRTFGDTWGATRIAGPWGAAEVSGWYDDGERAGLELTLGCGLKIDGTLNHRVWVRTTSGNEGWRSLAEVEVGDYVAVARGQADFGTREIPLDEAYALGLVIADGCTHGDQGLQIDKQTPVLEAVRPVVERWHDLACVSRRVRSRMAHHSPWHQSLHTCGAIPRLFKDLYDIDWRKSPERVVPPAVRRGTREVVRAFLRGYFDGDGYCDRAPAVSTVSPRLASEVQQLLLGFGIISTRRYKLTTHKPAHIIAVTDVGAFAREIGFTPYGLTKDQSFQRLLTVTRNTNVDVVPGLGGVLAAAAQWLPRRHRLRKWTNYFNGERRPSYTVLREWLENLAPDCPQRAELERLVAEHRFWSPVVSLAPSVARRIDCEVAEQHAFVGNGIVNHNTTIASSIISESARAGQRTLFVAHRRELVTQAYRRLIDHGVEASQLGVIMASDPRRNPGAMVQVASVDTLRFRNKPRADWLFFDEAHRALSPSFKNLAAEYPNAIHIGLTATPYRADGQGLGELYDELVVVASPKELMRQGFLVEPRVFTVPAHALPDLSTVKVRGGDYDERELADAVDRRQLVGNIVEHWRKHADGVRTVVFAVSIAHSKHIVERFQEAGVRAEHLDGGTPMLERDAILARLDRGETQVVGSIGTLCEGTDIPSVKCAILARPTKSTGLYLQQAGRILRPYQGQAAVILDHAGCVLEHGLPHRDREFTLESRKKGTRTREPAEPQAKACPECQCVLAPQARTCPACGHEFAVSVEATLPEETADELEVATDDDVQRAIWDRLCAEQLAKGFKPGWVYYTYRARFGEPPEHFPRPSAAPDRSSPQGLPNKLRHLTSASKGRLSWDAIDQMLGS